METGNSLKQIASGKVALVTGAGKGRGREIAEILAGRGVTVAANDVTPVNLDETVRRIQSKGGNVRAYVEDMAKKMPIQTLLNDVLNDLGKIDILIHCAEVEPRATVLEMDEWDWQRTVDVNLSGAFLLIQSTGRIMKESGSGTIIQMDERAKGREQRAAYFASKAGIRALIEQAAVEFESFGVRVYLVRSVEEAVEACDL